MVLSLVNPDSVGGFQLGVCDPDFTFVAWVDEAHGSIALQVSEEEKYWLRADFVPFVVAVDIYVQELRDSMRCALWGDAYLELRSNGGLHFNCATVTCGQADFYIELEFHREAQGAWRRVSADGAIMYSAAQVQNRALECARDMLNLVRTAAAARP